MAPKSQKDDQFKIPITHRDWIRSTYNASDETAWILGIAFIIIILKVILGVD